MWDPFFGVAENFLLHKKALHVDDVHPREDRAEQMELWQVLILNRNKKKKFVFSESWENIRNSIKISFKDIYVWKLTFLLTPFILRRGKVKKRNSNVEGQYTIREVIERVQNIILDPFFSLLRKFKGETVHCLCHSRIALRFVKRYRKGEGRGSWKFQPPVLTCSE